MARTKRTYPVTLLTPQGKEKWKVKLARLPQNQHEKNFGTCSFDKRVITIDDRHSFEEIIMTAIHEAAHAALGIDYAEPAIERIEHNAFTVAWLFLKDKLKEEE